MLKVGKCEMGLSRIREGQEWNMLGSSGGSSGLERTTRLAVVVDLFQFHPQHIFEQNACSLQSRSASFIALDTGFVRVV